MLKIGILSSTKGTDMQAIIDAINAKKLNAEISIVISNKGAAFALERARKHGIKVLFIDPLNYDVSDDKEKSRENYDKKIAEVLEKNNVGLILLIGYMKYMSKWFVRKF